MSRTPLKIVVLRGAQEGEEFFLTKRITRLGSDAGCDIRIEGSGVPAHAVSIENGDDVLVYNRAESPLTVGGGSVAPQESAIWKQGKDLLLPGQIQLRLEAYSVKAASAPKRVEFEEEEEEQESPVADHSPDGSPAKTSSKSSKSNAGPIAFIVACALLVVMLIIKKSAGDAAPSAAAGVEAMTWEKVWTEFEDEKRADLPETHELRRTFQHLYRLQNSPGSPNTAKWKSAVLQALIAAESEKSPDHEFHQRLRTFVNNSK